MATATNAKGLYAALLEVQKEAPQLRKDAKAEVPTKSGGKFTYTYMTLEAMLGELMPVLHKHGILVVQAPTHIDGHPALRTVLIHPASGESHETETPLLLAPSSDSQAWGGAITYARRYSLIAMLGLAAEDDDGQSARPRAQQLQGNGKGDGQFTPPTGKPITQARRKKLDALVDQVEGAGDPPMRRDHIDAWCERRGVTYATITTGLADELEASLLKLAKTAGVA
jgi:hypothetical protein